jgi:hypothetical protein
MDTGLETLNLVENREKSEPKFRTRSSRVSSGSRAITSFELTRSDELLVGALDCGNSIVCNHGSDTGIFRVKAEFLQRADAGIGMNGNFKRGRISSGKTPKGVIAIPIAYGWPKIVVAGKGG